MKAAIYSLETGRILRTVHVPAAMVDIQCAIGEEFFLNCPDDATHITDNKPVNCPDIPIDEARSRQRLQISIDFNKRLATGRIISSLGFPIDARRSSAKDDLRRMEELAVDMEGSGGQSTTITDADDMDHEGITLDQVRILIDEIRTYYRQAYQDKRARVTALTAATTAEEVKGC